MSELLSGKELRAKLSEGRLITLPDSEVEVKVRPVQLRKLLERGVIPSDLYQLSMAGFPELSQEAESAEEMQKLTEHMQKYDNFIKAMLNAILVDLAVVDNPTAENEISTDTFSELDNQFLINVAQQPVKAWASFRRKQVERLLSLYDGENVPDTTE